ncbi:MAG: YgiT-type zinc finger protein [Phycisphaerales bacterium]|nr:YgiT-type zinc finger protein [Phycisphaerales bacterium]
MGTTTVRIPRGNRSVTLRLEAWTCPNCGEQFLTKTARQKLDQRLGLVDSTIHSNPRRRAG